MADFNHTTIEEEITMLGGMIEELDTQLEQTKQGKIKLVNIRAALASSIGVDLKTEDKDQLNLTFVVDGKETPTESE
mgnify:FL=1|tara:strand:+ start:333 stop:563 length:231 start_codon:yes stop_codon:yes gene_type:complete